MFWALHHDPYPLTSSQRHTLSWEAATERLIAASSITRDMQYRSNKFTDKFIAWMLEAVSYSLSLIYAYLRLILSYLIFNVFVGGVQ